MKTLLIFVLCTAALSGCPAGPEGNLSNSNKTANGGKSDAVTAQTKDDVEELEAIINLPVHPEEATWREETLDAETAAKISRPAGTKKMTAALKFTSEDSGKLTAIVEKAKPAEQSAINSEMWFPAELIAQSQMSGDETVKGRSYSAADFLRPPYSDGRITRVEGTDYFILELFGN